MAITWYRFEVGVSKDVTQWIWAAIKTGRIQVNESIAIVFHGSPLPVLAHEQDHIRITWKDKVEVEKPGIVSPDIEYILVYEDRAEIKLKVGQVIADFKKKPDVLWEA
jgi:hypothetical protein